MSAKLTALVEHYHRTYDLAYRFWKERNRFFVILLATLGIAALFSYDQRALDPRSWTVPGTSTPVLGPAPRAASGARAAEPRRSAFMLQLVCFVLNKDQGCGPESKSLEQLRATFPVDVFDGVVSVLVFYLMVNMLNHTSNIYRYYAYIDRMETTIRQEMSIPAGDPAFGRESIFYRSFRAPMQRTTRYFFILIMLGLLGFYFFVRLASELSPEGSLLGLAAHGLIGVLTFAMFTSYALLLLGWRHPKQTGVEVPSDRPPIS
jgi:hypothetical protein